MPTPPTLDPEKAWKPTLAVLPTALLDALLPYPTTIVVVVPLPPIDTGLLDSDLPMPTPQTLDPDKALLPPVTAVAMLVLDALLP